MKESPLLAKAIAAEHLIQVFYTYGAKFACEDTKEVAVQSLENQEASSLTEAYLQERIS